MVHFHHLLPSRTCSLSHPSPFNCPVNISFTTLLSPNFKPRVRDALFLRFFPSLLFRLFLYQLFLRFLFLYIRRFRQRLIRDRCVGTKVLRMYLRITHQPDYFYTNTFRQKRSEREAVFLTYFLDVPG